MKTRVTIGSDPEFFMKNGKGNLISSIPYIKGNKENPKPLLHGGNIQQDNVAVEFATKPVTSSEEFVDHLRDTLRDTLNELPKGYTLSVAPSTKFPESQLKDEKAKQFGCMPDFCAWDLVMNEAPSHPDPTFRSCGGHLHVGHLDLDGNPVHDDSRFLLDPMGKINMVKGMDIFHGIISTILDNSPEAIERRKLYGKAGCHRPTSYGVEYRTMSNWWTKSPNSSMLVVALTEDVITVINNGELDALIDAIGQDKIRKTIDTGDVETANKILKDKLFDLMSEDSKHYFEECLGKISKDDKLSIEWGI